jgi:hypothetical protein
VEPSVEEGWFHVIMATLDSRLDLGPLAGTPIGFVLLRRALGLGIGPAPDAEDVEIAVLRHQLTVLRRQVARPANRVRSSPISPRTRAPSTGPRPGKLVMMPASSCLSKAVGQRLFHRGDVADCGVLSTQVGQGLLTHRLLDLGLRWAPAAIGIAVQGRDPDRHAGVLRAGGGAQVRNLPADAAAVTATMQAR